MTKLITILILVFGLWMAIRLLTYWDQVRNEKEAEQKKQTAALNVSPDQLPGLPQGLTSSLETARKGGIAGLSSWLKTFGHLVQDPRKAWIELDLCVMMARENPPEARRIFAGVKARTPSSSPVWPRIEKLSKSYE